MTTHSVDAFSGLEGYTDQQLINAAQRCANVYAKIANQKFGCSVPIPVPISFDLCDENPSAAGMAIGSERISINLVLFRDNVRHILNATIPHEIAHLVQVGKFDDAGVQTQSHGAEWQEIMRQLGKDPFKYHTLDTTKAKAHYKASKKAKKAKTKDDNIDD